MAETNQLYNEISDYPDLCKIFQLKKRPDPIELYGKFKPSGVWLPKCYSKYYEDIRNFEVYPNDIWVLGLPKTGTTWTQEMVWLIAENLNFEGAKTDLFVRCPLLELDAIKDEDENCPVIRVQRNKVPGLSTMEYVKNHKAPRYIRSHLPFPLLPNQLKTGTKGKVVYVTRNPMDTMVSFFHYFKRFQDYGQTLDIVTDEYINGIGHYLPYWEHVKEFWERRNTSQVLFLTYEEMKRDLRSVIIKVASFLNKEYNENEINQLEEHLSFSSMKNNTAVNQQDIIQACDEANKPESSFFFLRKGAVGAWKEELSPESTEKFNQWMKHNEIPGLFDHLQ